MSRTIPATEQTRKLLRSLPKGLDKVSGPLLCAREYQDIFRGVGFLMCNFPSRKVIMDARSAAFKTQ